MTKSSPCVDCAHLSTRHYGYYCAHPILGTSCISGTPNVMLCHNARSPKYTYNEKYGFCKDGALFKAKPLKWWQKLFTRAKPQ